MQRTKEDIVALIQRGERFHAECKEAFGALPDALNFILLRDDIGQRVGQKV